MKFFAIIAASAALAFSAAPTQAAIVLNINQDKGEGAIGSLTGVDGFSQSFGATVKNIVGVGFYFKRSRGGNVTYSLYGADPFNPFGIDVNLLASKTVLANNYDSYVDAFFDKPVSLNYGHNYYIVARADNKDMTLSLTFSDPYPYGRLNVASTYDAQFRTYTDNGVVEPLTPAVPEPATWALMIGGFGIVGGAMRRRKLVSTTVKFA